MTHDTRPAGRRIGPGVVPLVALMLAATACSGPPTPGSPTAAVTSSAVTTSTPATKTDSAATSSSPSSTPPANNAPPASASAPSSIAGGAGATSSSQVPSPREVPSSSAPSTVEPVDVGLVLAPDGLGPVAFDSTYEETLATLIAVLGEPDFVGGVVYEPAIGNRQSVEWGHLIVTFSGGNALYFTEYAFGRRTDAVPDDQTGDYALVLADWEPTAWEAGLATAEGIGIGTTVAAAAEAYPQVYAPDCGGPLQPRTLTQTDPQALEQLFVQERESGVYLYTPIDGQIWHIGAQVAPNPLACDGAPN